MHWKPQTLVIAILAILLMAFVPALVKVNQANEVEIATVRLAIASLGMLFFIFFTKKTGKLTGSQWRVLVLLGVIFGLHWFLYFKSIKLSTPSIAAIAVSTFGIHVSVLSRWFLKQPLLLVDWLAIGFAAIGLYLVIPEFNWDSEYLLGALIGVASGFLYACLPIIHQKNLGLPGSIRTTGQFGFALLVFIPFGSAQSWELSQQDWLGLVFLGLVSTLLAHSFWVKATTELPGILSGIIYYLYIPAAMAMSIWLTGEQMTPRMAIGALIIVLANVVLVYVKWRYKPSPSLPINSKTSVEN